MTAATQDDFLAAPGSVVEIRDEQWLVTGVERNGDGWLVQVRGLDGLVRDTTATFATVLDDVRVLDPAEAQVAPDESPGYRRSRLWVEALLRKSPVPLNQVELTVATQGLADALPYQLTAVRQALDPDNLRPRILLADAVGLGKTIEIGMILAELVRRGRGERILIITPRHVLEQMQFELWTRFALPLVRLDSLGIQRIRQKLPATRNPFTYFKRVIVSIDTLKSERYAAHLEKHQWDAVVIDESHNVTNSASQNNQLAHRVARRTDALILASATPHNGKKESFAELVRMLEPSAVGPDGALVEEQIRRLVIRRHRHSPDVARVVGGDWAERRQPQNLMVNASEAENAVATELEAVWLHPDGPPPHSGANSGLFSWTLAKAFLSSSAALHETITERIRRLGSGLSPAQKREIVALRRLDTLAAAVTTDQSAKYAEFVRYLRKIGIQHGGNTRAVVFAERVPTLRWLQSSLRHDLGLADDQVALLHGGLSDIEQQDVVESFKQASSPIRVLVTGDVASEGVNLHTQCHELIHFDIPWSLIRIEQRNGRIDRYGQKHPPQITTLLLVPASEQFAGDVRVLAKLIEKEHEAHRALGDSASLMGKYDVKAEEEEIRRVLAEGRDLDQEIRAPEAVAQASDIAGLFARLTAQAPSASPDLATPSGQTAESSGLFTSDLDFLRQAVYEFLPTPGAKPPNGIGWTEHPAYSLVDFQPPADLRQRLVVLPQPYLLQRDIMAKLSLATTTQKGKAELAQALTDESQSLWPEAHYLSPLHPVLDWASDRALSTLGRNRVFALQADVEVVTILLQGTLTNTRGQVIASSFLIARFPNPDNPQFVLIEPYPSAAAALAAAGATQTLINTNDPSYAEGLTRYMAPAVRAAQDTMTSLVDAAASATKERVERWQVRAADWESDAGTLIQRANLQQRRQRIEHEQETAAAMLPDRTLVRPLLVVVPAAPGPTAAHRPAPDGPATQLGRSDA